jgi:integrase/recombinase XerD
MPKLPRNMVRKNGRYYYRKLINGKEVSRPLGASYRRAYLKLKEFERAEPAGPTATVKDLAELWCERYVATARRDLADRKKVGQRKRKYLLPFLGIKPLHLVTPDDLRAYRVWLEQQGIADQTVKHVLSEARCFFNWAVDSGYLAKSPVPKRLMPKIQERLPDRLTDAEVDELVQLPNPFGFAIRLGVGTGLRWGEMIRADAAHFRNGMLEVEHTKSGKVRRVPLTLPGLERELRTRVGRLLPFAGSSTPFNKWAREHSSVKRFHAHMMRHAFACRWLEAGGSLAALQEILGHASIVTTQVYARLSEEHVRAEAERIRGKLGKNSGMSWAT